MSQDIFFSNVNPTVQYELTARANAGFKSRTNDDLKFMLEKIANVKLSVDVKYQDKTGKDQVQRVVMPARTLNESVDNETNLFSPTGVNSFLNSIKTGNTVNESQDSSDIVTIIAGGPFNLVGRRTPFFLQNIEVSVGDNSYGVLNTATFTIHVPNLVDLDLVDTMFMVPGQTVNIEIEYPNSACLTYKETKGGNLNPLISTVLLNALSDKEKQTITDLQQKQKLHVLQFTALTHSYDIQYNKDFTADVTVQVVGASIAASNVAMLVSQQNKTADRGDVVINEITEKNAKVIDEETPNQSLFKSLQTEVNNIKTKDKQGKLRKDINSKFETDGSVKNYLASPDATEAWVIWGKPYPKSGKTYTYITLQYLVDFINRQCLSRLGAEFRIIFLRKLTRSIEYKYLISADPEIMFFPGQSIYSTIIDWYGDSSNWTDGDDTLTFGGYITEEGEYEYAYSPTAIFINIETIKTILDSKKAFKVNEFLDEISKIVYDLSGHAMDLKLLTHPDIATTSTSLCWYDTNATVGDRASPYVITMTPEKGSAVYDFSLSARLPENAGTVLYLSNNSDDTDVAESNIAPFLTYFYNSSKYFATSADGYSERIVINNETVPKSEREKYEAKHNQYLTHLANTKNAYTVGNPQTAINLQNALRKYVQYPSPDLITSNALASTILPYEVSFTIDGLNGFKYGDIVNFDILPLKYKISVVFVITSVTHTVTSEGTWSTTCRCQMKTNMKV